MVDLPWQNTPLRVHGASLILFLHFDIPNVNLLKDRWEGWQHPQIAACLVTVTPKYELHELLIRLLCFCEHVSVLAVTTTVLCS